jgi:hypothetical protein
MRAPIGNVDLGTTEYDYLMHRTIFPDGLIVQLNKTNLGTKYGM